MQIAVSTVKTASTREVILVRQIGHATEPPPHGTRSSGVFLALRSQYKHPLLVRPFAQGARWLPEDCHQSLTQIGLRLLASFLPPLYARCSAIQSEEKRRDIDAADCAIRPRANADNCAYGEKVQNRETKCFPLARLRPHTRASIR